MRSPADRTTRASHSSSVPVQESSYLSCPEGRIGYRFLAAALRAAGYRVACTGFRGHGGSGATFTSYGDEGTAGDVIALIGEPGDPAVAAGNSMGAGSAVLAAAQRPGLVLTGPFVRNGKTSAMRRLLLRVAMAPPWAAISWTSCLPKLYGGRRPADFGGCRDQVVASLRRPGYARAFCRAARTGHDPAGARLADVTAPALVVMGEQDPDFGDPRAEPDWIACALHTQVVMVPGAGPYPQSQRPGITAGIVLRFLESVTGRA
jgi:pimeloyl-ACP methyl ester carboxylesterase